MQIRANASKCLTILEKFANPSKPTLSSGNGPMSVFLKKAHQNEIFKSSLEVPMGCLSSVARFFQSQIRLFVNSYFLVPLKSPP